MTIDLTHLNFGAILVASCSSFLLWGLWYSPWLFEISWLETSGLTPFDLQNADPKKVMSVSFVAALMISCLFAILIGPSPHPGSAVLFGFVTGIGWISSVLAINYVFEQKPLKLFLINSGYHTLQFTLIGAVFGFWPY